MCSTRNNNQGSRRSIDILGDNPEWYLHAKASLSLDSNLILITIKLFFRKIIYNCFLEKLYMMIIDSSVAI